MNKLLLELGTVVRSKAGRDIDRYFVVVGKVDEQYLLIADGDLRKLAKPKRKKIKHLEPKPACMSEIQTKLARGECVQDTQIRKFLASNGYKPLDQQKE